MLFIVTVGKTESCIDHDGILQREMWRSCMNKSWHILKYYRWTLITKLAKNDPFYHQHQNTRLSLSPADFYLHMTSPSDSLLTSGPEHCWRSNMSLRVGVKGQLVSPGLYQTQADSGSSLSAQDLSLWRLFTGMNHSSVALHPLKKSAQCRDGSPFNTKNTRGINQSCASEYLKPCWTEEES